MDDVLGRIFSPVSHLNSVKNSPELREAYEQTLPLLSEYSTWVGQHEGLYKAYRDLRDGDHYATLNTAQKKRLITHCATSNSLASVCRKRNSSVTAKLPLVFLNWAISTATTSSMRRWAGPNSLPTKRSWRGCQKARWLRQKPRPKRKSWKVIC
ncbi:hypothetical protein ACVV37_02870 [Escherichia coli]